MPPDILLVTDSGQKRKRTFDQKVLNLSAPLADKLTHNLGKISCYKWKNLPIESILFSLYLAKKLLLG